MSKLGVPECTECGPEHGSVLRPVLGPKFKMSIELHPRNFALDNFLAGIEAGMTSTQETPAAAGGGGGGGEAILTLTMIFLSTMLIFLSLPACISSLIFLSMILIGAMILIPMILRYLELFNLRFFRSGSSIR